MKCKDNRCENKECREDVLCQWLNIIYSVLGATIVLYFPFVNAINGESTSMLREFFGVNISGTAVFIIILWVFSIITNSAKQHSSVLDSVLGSMGLPGMFLGVSSASLTTLN